MNRKARQQLLLGLLLVILLIVTWRQFGPRWSATGGAGLGRAAGTSAGFRGGSDERIELPEVLELRLAELQAATGELEQGRNPFSVSRPQSVAPPPKPPAAELREAMERARAAREQAQSAVEVAPSIPRPPPVDVVFLGSFGPESRRLAVFTDGREIFNAREGEVVKEKFVVVRIGFESADLGFVDFPESPAQRLEIGG